MDELLDAWKEYEQYYQEVGKYMPLGEEGLGGFMTWLESQREEK